MSSGVGVAAGLAPAGSIRVAEVVREAIRSRWWSSVGIASIAIALWVLRLNGPIDLRYDGGVYYVLGTSLATGQGYRILSEPGAPEGIQYPPGLPAIVAAHQLVLRSTDPAVVGPWLRRTYAVIFLGLALSSLALARQYLPPIWALLATALCLLQVNTYMLSDLLFTELPFSLTAVWLVLVLNLAWLRDKPLLRETAGFVLAAAAFLLRTAGVALLLAWVVEALMRGEFRRALVRAVLCAVPFGLWQAHVARVQGSPEYRHPAYAYQRAPYQFNNVTYGENLALAYPFEPARGRVTVAVLAQRLKDNLEMLPLALGEVVSESTGFWMNGIDALTERMTARERGPEILAMVPLICLTTLLGFGLVLLARRGAGFLVVFVVASIGLVMITPWPDQAPRYLAPLGPFLAIATVLSAAWLSRHLSEIERGWERRFGRSLLFGLILLTLAEQAVAAASCFRYRRHSPVVAGRDQGWRGPRFFYYDRSWTDLRRAAAWIAKHSPPDTIVATDSPQLVYLDTGLHAVLPPMEADPARARQLLEQVPVSFVIVDELEFMDVARRFALPAVSAGEWRLVRTFNRTRVYRYVGIIEKPPPPRLAGTNRRTPVAFPGQR